MSVAPVPPEKRFYRFDGYVVDPVRRLLLCDGKPVAITPKAFSILLALIDRHGEVVEKRGLIQRVWPDSFVTEANLTQNISSLRKALGERAGEHRYILTVPGQGYSFAAEAFEVVEVEAAEPEPAEAPSAPESAPEDDPPEEILAPEPVAAPSTPASTPIQAPARRRRPWAVAALLVGALALGAALAVLATWRDGPVPAAGRDEAGPGSRRRAVAVLTFRNSSGDRFLEWLGPALTDMIRTDLAAGAGLRVISGQEVTHAGMALSGPEARPGVAKTLEALRTRFGVDLVVEGSFVSLSLPLGERQLRLDLRVVNLRSGEVEASMNETGSYSQLLDLVTRASERLRDALEIEQLSPEGLRAARAAHSTSTEATRLHTQAREFLRASNPAAALLLLERAVQADPGSALIRSTLSRAWSELGYEGRAAAEARAAMARSRSLPMAEKLAVEGWSHEAAKDWPQATEAYRSLWTYFPDDVEYGLRLAQVLTMGGRAAEALQALAELRKLDPPDSEDPRIDIAEASAAQRLPDPNRQLRVAQAAEAKGRRRGEDLVVGQALLLQGSAHMDAGRMNEAAVAFQQAKEIHQRVGDRWGIARSLMYLGVLRHRLGYLDLAGESHLNALKIAKELDNARGIAVELANLGWLYHDRGDLTQAQRYLERSQAKLAEIGDRLTEQRIIVLIAAILTARGNLDAAATRLDQALVMSRKVGSRFDEAGALADLGSVAAAQGRLKEALRRHEEALRIFRELGSSTVSNLLWKSGDVLVSLGELAAARERYDQALAAKREEGDRIGAGRVLGSLARLAFYTGDLASARAWSAELLQIARATGARSLEARALKEMGRVDLATEPASPRAQQRLEMSLRMSLQMEETLTAEETRLDLARVFEAQGKVAEALRITGEVAAWSRTRRIPAWEARALEARARMLLGRGDLDGAVTVAVRLRELVRTYSEDRLLRALVTPALARVQAAQGDLEGARGELRQAFAEAAKLGIVPASLEARRALGEIELAHGDREKALRDLDGVRQEAESRGFHGPVQKEAGR